MREVVEWATTQARSHLKPLGDRWLHTEAVAERAQRLSVVLPQDDRRLFVAAAWVHDIGYASHFAVSGFHSLDGARYLLGHGHEQLAGLVAHRTGARHEAALRGLDSELSTFPRNHGDIAALLTLCDITVGPQGQSMTPQRRIEDVLHRYGINHVVTRGLFAAWDEISDQLNTAQLVWTRYASAVERQAAEQRRAYGTPRVADWLYGRGMSRPAATGGRDP